MGATSANGGLVLVADEDAAVRGTLAELLARAAYEPRELACGKEVLEVARSSPPRLVLLDVRLPGLCGYEVCHQLREEFGQALPIMFLSADRTEPLDRVAGLLIGADDYIVKPFAPDEVLARVRRLTRRTNPVRPSVASKLTNREMEVLRLLAEGLEQQEIARQLFISRKTVGTHIEHILAKLGVRSRAQAVALAYREDLVAAS